MSRRFLISLGLILSLLLTSQAMASLRAAPAAAGTVVICIGGAALVVHVDAEGQPVAAPHFCPDCALQAAPVPQAASANVVAVLGTSVRSIFRSDFVLPDAAGCLPPSRAPPVFV